MMPSRFRSNRNILIILCLNLFTIVKTTDLDLKLVQVLFRHGDRSPIKTYPTDPWKNAWPDGLGQLTTIGMQQQFYMGQYIRKQYGHLINDTYNTDVIYIRSTNVDRTLMSAYSNLAGFLPPEGRHIWNKNLDWQPIPVHTMPEEEDHVLSMSAKCPKYTKLFNELMQSDEVKKFDSQYRDLYKFLANKTGLTINDFNQASELYDILLVDRIHNLTLPEWANETVISDLQLFEIMFFYWSAKTREMARLVGGPLVGEMRKNMQNAVKNSTNVKKFYMYSAHDTTVSSLLSALDVFDRQAPPYCSMVIVELWEGINSTNFIKILYRNDTTREPYELVLKGCESLCPYEEFKKLTAAIVPNDIKEECSVHDENVALISAIAGSILGCALVILILSAYALFKRHSTSYRYLNVSSEI